MSSAMLSATHVAASCAQSWARFAYRTHRLEFSMAQQHSRSWAGFHPAPAPCSHGCGKVNEETVTVHYRFHPLAGTRATTPENRSHRGEPIVVVADSDGHRYHLPLWMTAPDAAQWGLRDCPRLSHSALSELRDLIAIWSAQPAPPATGDRDEMSKATEAAEDADVRAAGSGQPAGGRETGGGGGSGGADCGGDVGNLPRLLARSVRRTSSRAPGISSTISHISLGIDGDPGAQQRHLVCSEVVPVTAALDRAGHPGAVSSRLRSALIVQGSQGDRLPSGRRPFSAHAVSHAGMIQSRFAPVGTVGSHGLFAK